VGLITPLKWARKSLMKFFQNKKFIFISLLAIMFLGGFLRFYNLNWDEGHFFHPDERNIANAVSRINFFKQLNPQFFAYGSLPFYFYRIVGDFLTLITKNQNWVREWSFINLIGRNFSAFFSTLTIGLVFLLVKKIWENKRLALLAAFFIALSPSFIQNAHFAITESLLVFWVLLILYFSLDLREKPSLKNYLKIGLIGGLAIATKISAISFLIIPGLAHLLYQGKNLKKYFLYFFSLLIAFLTFAFFSPYVFLDKIKFWESMNYENGVVLGKLKVPYILQFEKTLPYLFQIKNFFWQIGPMAIIGLLGFLLMIFIAIKTKNKSFGLFLVFPFFYFAYVGSWYTKFLRYMLPFLPFLIISGSWFLIQTRNKFKILGNFLIVLFCLSSLFWGLSFFTVYLRPQTRIIASEWVYQNIPISAKILTEHWDDGLPINIPPYISADYKSEQLTIYEPDNEKKINYYADKLSEADYLILNSRRLYGTLMFLPEKYPLTSRYYQLLFNDKLGYQKVAEFTSYPHFLSWEINDDQSEETFQVYDHPKVIIFQNKNYFSADQIKEILE
jgi:4-amino-4-deoxy-L-arabinose transferase-like glycosyltransferase